MDLTKSLHQRGGSAEVLTVDNHADGPFLYLRLEREDPKRAAEVLELLQMNEGNQSGIGIASVSWDGSVYADQFWRHHSFGNVRERPFSEIWTDLSDDLMRGLKDRKKLLQGRCAQCRWLDICNGNFRVRAEAVHGDVWAPDPRLLSYRYGNIGEIEGKREMRNGRRQKGIRQKAGGRRETGDGRRETGDGRRETGNGRRGDGKRGNGRRETEDGGRETEDGKRETGDGRRETGDGRQQTADRKREIG